MRPKLIEFPKHKAITGTLVVADQRDIPFQVRRCFWLHDLYDERGGHALRECHQLLVVMTGKMTVITHDGLYTKFTHFKRWRLDNPNMGLYLPPMVWRDLKDFEPGTTCFILCSTTYKPDDYIRDIDEFLKEARK